MSQTLHLIRHAKSSWDYPRLSDHQRPLKNRGFNDCALIAEALFQKQLTWPSTWVSSAVRAQSTMQTIAEHWPGRPLAWSVSDDLYEFSSHALMRWLVQQFQSCDELLLVGHNPALHDVIDDCTGADLENFPTCAYARIEHLDLQQGSGELAALITPKMLK